MNHTLLQDVQKYFPIETFRPYQEEVIQSLLNRNDVLAIMPTGSGKSICYQYVATKLKGLTIVVSPLIALMQDQIHHLQKLNIPAVCINSEISKSQRQNIFSEIIQGAYKLLYVSPERLSSASFQRFIRMIEISMVVIDEAHCMSLWGYDFRMEYLKISRFFHLMDQRPIVSAFSATITPLVKKDIISLLNMKNPIVVEAGYYRKNLNISIKHCHSNYYKFKSIYAFLDAHKESSGMIYCSTIENVKIVYEKLIEKKYSVGIYHASMDEKEKRQNYISFMNNEIQIMVCTNAFGMGIDKRDIRYVLHFDPPKDIESYIQQIGRSARDGGMSSCILYYTPKDDKTMCALSLNSSKSLQLDNELLHVVEDICQYRLYSMMTFVKKGNHKKSQELQNYIQNYFSKDFESTQNLKQLQIKFLKSLEQPDLLYTNETKVSKWIRNGTYQCDVLNVVEVSSRKLNRMTVSFSLDSQLDYFDLMVCDAIYTLYAWGKKKIFLQNILVLLSGDENVTMKPISKTKDRNDKRKCIEDSIEKMMKTTLYIDQTDGNIGVDFVSGKCPNVIKGLFLNMKKEGQNGYILLETPLLYKYAEMVNGQFFSIPKNLLSIESKGKKLPSSIENLKLKHFLARRYILSNPQRSLHSNKPMSKIIRFTCDQNNRKGMFEILDFTFDEDIQLKKRKWQTLCKKVEEILNDYKNKKKIMDYQWIKENEIRFKNKIVGVKIIYYPY